MRFLSVCSGIEAASVAWAPLGWRAVALSEVAPFPSKLLAHHYPDVPNLGDMTKFTTWPDATFDLLCGGTPCQSFSAAGLRKGLEDPRGNLMLTFCAIAARYRPKWIVWENVPGVLSSNRGRDFGSFLGALADIGYGFAYRVLDAQYFGLAQRRKRVFVVGCLGDWRRPAQVLFEPESLRWNSSQSGGKRSGIARCLTRGSYQRGDGESETYVAHTLRGEGFDASEDGTGRGTPLTPVVFGAQNSSSQGDCCSSHLAPTLDKSKIPGVLTHGVRRLTPRECERLQGFPDDYTLHPSLIKKNGDDITGPRYKAIGNSWAVPVVRWIGERIQAVEEGTL